MSYEKLLQDLADKKYAPVYFLQGTESYYINKIVDFVENDILPVRAKSFDMRTFYGQEVSLQEVIIQAKRFPMMATLQVVLVKEAQELQDLHRDKGQQQLIQYLAQPNPQTLLLFAYKDKTLDQRRALAKQLAQRAVLFTAKKVGEKELPQWIEAYVRGKGYVIDHEASYMLITLIGDNLQRLANALDKMLMSLEDKESITRTMVRTHVTPSKTFDIFDLQQAIQTHQTNRIWSVVEHFAQHPKKYPLLPQITLLMNFFSKLLLLHQTSHRSTAHIAAKLGISPYFARSYQEALQHYSFAQTMQNLQYLHEADLQLKGIDAPPLEEPVLLKTLVAKLLGNP